MQETIRGLQADGGRTRQLAGGRGAVGNDDLFGFPCCAGSEEYEGRVFGEGRVFERRSGTRHRGVDAHGRQDSDPARLMVSGGKDSSKSSLLGDESCVIEGILGVDGNGDCAARLQDGNNRQTKSIAS